MTKAKVQENSSYSRYRIFNKPNDTIPIELLALIFSFLSKEELIPLVLTEKAKEALRYLLNTNGPEFYGYDRKQFEEYETQLKLKLKHSRASFGGTLHHYPLLFSFYAFTMYGVINLAGIALTKGRITKLDVLYYAGLDILSVLIAGPVFNLIAEGSLYLMAKKALGPQVLYDNLPEIYTQQRDLSLAWQKNQMFNETVLEESDEPSTLSL